MSEVAVQFLGTGDAFGSGGRFQTCFYVSSGLTHFLIDCGASSLIAMRRYGVEPSLVDTILLTHLHGDHFGGVPFFLLDAQLVSRRTRPLTIAGPPGVRTRVREAMEVLFPGSTQALEKLSVEFVELTQNVAATIGALVVTAYEVVHPSGAPAYALRVETAGKTVAYSGDTEWTDTLFEAARGADVFICEAYSFEKNIKFHLDYQTVRRQLANLASRRLIVTHMHADMLDRLASVDVEWAQDGGTVVL